MIKDLVLRRTALWLQGESVKQAKPPSQEVVPALLTPSSRKEDKSHRQSKRQQGEEVEEKGGTIYGSDSGKQTRSK